MSEQKPEINWCDCESSNVAKHGYCGKTNTLAIEYKNGGGVYHYPNVKPEMYEEMKKAKSVGSFVSTNITKKKLSYKKI